MVVSIIWFKGNSMCTLLCDNIPHWCGILLHNTTLCVDTIVVYVYDVFVYFMAFFLYSKQENSL